jgi:hypothetical protein
VGIATVVAINIFGTAADQANRDAVRQDLMSAAVQAQGIWARPEMMGGAGFDFTDTDAISAGEILERLSIPGQLDDPSDPTLVTNENGEYSVSAVTASQLNITGTPSSGGVDIIAVVCQDTNENWIVNIDEETADAADCVTNTPPGG